jgi:type III restriction enzyme
LSEDDKERAFENLIKINLNGFAFKRSLSPVKNSLYRWFKKYIGINLFGNGIIYIQNIVLNNYEVFGKLFDEAVTNYRPIKNKEKLKKIEEAEARNNNWEISESRNYNPFTYKPFQKDLSLYKSPQDKQVYLNFDSGIEKEFVDFFEKNKDKILWWWQNGNEHMALNFGIKYGEGLTFQPDFLVMFKDGQLGIYDTKSAGYQEDDNKIKAEALQKYIKEENKRKKKKILTGGLVIKVGDHFRINSDLRYESFKIPDKVYEKESEYKKKREKNKKGWKILEF